MMWDGCRSLACALNHDCEEETLGLTGMGSEGDRIGHRWGDLFR
jgi:hypothetical protein